MKKRQSFLKKVKHFTGVFLLEVFFLSTCVYAKNSDENYAPNLSEERNQRILTSYILDVESILPGEKELRIRVINSYDDILKEEDSRIQDLSHTMYTVQDINGDEMPDLIIKNINDNFCTYKAYTYDLNSNSIESISEAGVEELDAEGDLDFRYAYPEKIWEDSADIDADGEKEKVSVYIVKNERGYVCMLVYLDGSKALAMQTSGNSDKADIHIYSVKDQKALFYLRLYSDIEDEYCAILQLSEGSFKEMINMDGEKKNAVERPLAFGRVDLDQDGEKELILRKFTSDAVEGGEYIYQVYDYDRSQKKYEKLPDAVFYSRVSGGMIRFDKETGLLFIDESMGENCFEAYSLKDKKLEWEYESYEDLRYLEKVKFKRIEFAQKMAETTNISEGTGQSENKETSENSEAVQISYPSAFYGIWCYGSKEEGDAYNYADSLKTVGFSAEVFLTTDWGNLNTEKYYVVTAGTYRTENDANASLPSVQNFCADAYVKYSGDYQGQ